jgi:Transport and Golgi organisation 2
MCTVTLVPSLGRQTLRLVMNRDEQRLRPQAWPPQFSEVGGLHVVWPVDPVGKGTWVAASQAGLLFALINLHTGPQARGVPGDRDPARSRARVIPALAGAVDLEDAAARWQRLDPARFDPFQLIVASRGRAALMTWHGAARAMTFVDLDAPLMLTSSSLGDAFVERPRHDLFRSVMDSAVEPWQAQDRFHQHAWPDRRETSVLMSRIGACTVSRTVLRLSEDCAEVAYYPLVEGWPGPVSRATLAVHAARRAPVDRRAAVA